MCRLYRTVAKFAPVELNCLLNKYVDKYYTFVYIFIDFVPYWEYEK